MGATLLTASGPAAAAPGCFKRSAGQVEAGVVDDGYDYFAARHFANPACGAYDPARAEALYRRALIHAGGPNIAAGYWALLRREPALARRPGAPSEALLFRIAAVGALSARKPAEIRAFFAGVFHGAAPPEAFMVLEEILAASDEARLSRLVADARDEPLLRGATLYDCMWTSNTGLSRATRFACALFFEEMATSTIYAVHREMVQSATSRAFWLLAMEGHPDALLHGARRFLALGDAQSLESAYLWLSWEPGPDREIAALLEELDRRIPASRRYALRSALLRSGWLPSYPAP